jgi:DNA replication protein DnaC
VHAVPGATATPSGIASWGEIFDDHSVAAAILDRLLHHATVLQCSV